MSGLDDSCQTLYHNLCHEWTSSSNTRAIVVGSVNEMQDANKQNVEKDKEAIISIVKEMAASMTGQQSTKHWAQDALWFDIPAFASRGVQPARNFFDKVFSGFESCKVDLLETDAVVNGNMGMVCTVQRVDVKMKSGDAKSMIVRETDVFEKRGKEWQLIHQHASVPAGGAWDGKIART